MLVLQCDHVGFGYAGQTLFSDVTFALHEGERLGLVAPNGAGKTSLLRLLMGALEPQEGRVILPKGVRVGYVQQTPALQPEHTVWQALASRFKEAQAAQAELEAAALAVAHHEPQALERLERAQHALEQWGSHAHEHRVRALAHQVRLEETDWHRSVETLSGGERGRLAMAMELAHEPQLLLLDEPTNHLDMESVEKLEQVVKDFSGGVLLVSHDRAFLDAVCTHTAELGRSKFRFYSVPYSSYLVLRQKDLELETALRERQNAQIARTEDFIRRNLAGQKTKQAKSRRIMLDKMERLQKPEDVWGQAKRLAFRFADAERSGDIALEAKHVRSARGGRVLVADLSVRVRRGDRIGIVGRNGAGKSSLLRVLAGLPAPEDGGKVNYGSNIVQGYFDQHLETLKPDASAIDEIRSVRGDLTIDAVRSYLGRFRFGGDDPFRRVASFSGGERTRLALAKLLLVPRNLLFLDEPTNHLDIPATEILEEALQHFDGTVLLVSHDRYFLDQVCTHILHVESGITKLYHGNFSEFRTQQKQMLDIATSSETQVEATSVARKEHGQRKAAQRELERKMRAHAKLEQEIAELEAKHAQLRQELNNSVQGDWVEIQKLAEVHRDVEELLSEKLELWSALSVELETPETER